MPDYPTAMSCWNAISSYGSVVSLFSIFFAWHTWLEGANHVNVDGNFNSCSSRKVCHWCIQTGAPHVPLPTFHTFWLSAGHFGHVLLSFASFAALPERHGSENAYSATKTWSLQAPCVLPPTSVPAPRYEHVTDNRHFPGAGTPSLDKGCFLWLPAAMQAARYKGTESPP